MAKIAILHEILGRSRGGIEAWIFHSSDELIHLGHEVVLFHTMGDNIPEDAAPIGVKTISFDTKKVYPSVFFLRSVFSYRSQLKGVLEEYDHVWSRSFGMAWAVSSIIGRKAIYINAAPYSYYAFRPIGFLLKNANSIKDIGRAISFQLSYIAAWYFEKEAIKNSINIFLSQKRKEQTLSFFKLDDLLSQFKVVPAGVDYNRFLPSTIFEPSNSDLCIISICRLDKLKNIQCVVHAVKILVREGKKVKYSIIGDGPYKEVLVKLVEQEGLDKFISFKGRQSNVEQWYRDNHIFVLPSLYEGFGSVYVEAMSCGLPCIAISNKNGEFSVAADEIIDHGLNGYLLDENSPIELANYIRIFIDNRKLLDQFGKAARETVLKKFTWKKTVDAILQA